MWQHLPLVQLGAIGTAITSLEVVFTKIGSKVGKKITFSLDSHLNYASSPSR